MTPPSSLSLAAPRGGRPSTDRQSRIREGKLGQAATAEAPWVRALLIALALGFMTLFLFIPLLTVFAEVPGFVALASPRLMGPRSDALKAHLLGFANGSEEGKAFFASTGFVAMREVAPGLMESMDQYVAATRRMLSA